MKVLLIIVLTVLFVAASRSAARWNEARKKRLAAFQKAWDEAHKDRRLL